MNPPDFSLEHLKALPLRAVVAFATRCARRVEHLAQLPEGHPQRECRRKAVAAALDMAESFARGEHEMPDQSVMEAVDASRRVADCPARSSDAASAVCGGGPGGGGRLVPDRRPWRGHARTSGDGAWLSPGVRSAWRVTADAVVLDALIAAADVLLSIGTSDRDLVTAARNDYETLLRLKLGRYPEPGAPIDPSPEGPLGPLGPRPLERPPREVA